MINFLKKLVPMRVLYQVARVYWFVRRPASAGAKIVLVCEDSVLFIRHTYQPESWTFPGGGIKRGENPESAVVREVREEVGITLASDAVSYCGKFSTVYDFKNDTVSVYYARVPDFSFMIEPLEIAEARWFTLDHIPELAPNAERIFDIVWNAKSHIL